jgi:ribosomal protein L19E
MRFAQGKEAERIVQRGVRTLSVSEKRKLGLSLTNTYYVRQDLKRLTKRSVLVSSRQARQARQRLGVELSKFAQRALGKAGRRGGVNALLKKNRDYIEGKISLDQVKRQFGDVVRLSQSDSVVRIMNWRKDFEWYVRTLRDGNQQLVMSWSLGAGMGAGGCIKHLSDVILSLVFFLAGYSLEINSKDNWSSSVTVEREIAIEEIDKVNMIIAKYRAGEGIDKEDFEDVYLFKRLLELLIGYEGTIIYTFVIRLTWKLL